MREEADVFGAAALPVRNGATQDSTVCVIYACRSIPLLDVNIAENALLAKFCLEK